jgi:hypothetical protein
MRIFIETIPHEKQRYPTCGDWRTEFFFSCKCGSFRLSKDCLREEANCPRCHEVIVKEEVLAVYVSQLSDWRREVALILHELSEALFCRADGITAEQVDAYDFAFEEKAKAGMYKNEDEPGDQVDCPYREQHVAASDIEMRAAKTLRVDWGDYNVELSALPYQISWTPPKKTV